jgi:hypothetical protein
MSSCTTHAQRGIGSGQRHLYPSPRLRPCLMQHGGHVKLKGVWSCVRI